MNELEAKLAKAYKNLSAGDRSCIAELLKTPGAVQLTTDGSNLDKFFTIAEKLGWSKKEILEIGGIKSPQWSFSSLGEEGFPNFFRDMFDLDSTSEEDKSDNWEPLNDDWQPIDDRKASDGFAVRDEQAPILKYAVGILALLLVGGGAVWLASKVVIADEVPVIERAEKPAEEEKPQAPKSADDEAWVKALETDTVEGYRAYLTAFPNGRHVEDAQRLINEFDEEAWSLADERNTVQGYEDYLASWPEGLHATEARDRIAKIKAEEEARRKNAQEAARQEAAAWKAAAEANTIPSYEGYLSKFPSGKNAGEAQSRIDRLRASAADEGAWTAAKAVDTADAYQQYLTSFPQGAHVAEAIARIEELRPGPGKTFKDCAACPMMVTLPAGTAELGAQATDAKAKPNEKPARPVTFTNLFAIGVTEVTFAEYGACVAAGGCKSMPSDNGWGQGSRPVINVSWSDAVAYAQWLSNTTGKNYGLPSGAQWEYAARGGKTDALIGGSPKAVCAFANGASKESELPWANESCTDLAADRTLPAGSLSKNGFGTSDMIGNVSEWVLDCNTLNLRDAPVDGSADARGSCSQRIVRGGSWFSGPDDLRYSARAVQRRGDTNDFTGFRVVRN
ncbi:MAG: SUMF1/EgtB/PvdO family nonheme iron enzyme [Litorimonas sp.]